MASLNRVIILGNLGQDPDLRHTASQNAVCNFSVATTDYRNSPDGQKQEFTEWHRVVVWGRTAENCAKYLTKGSPVMIEGRLQTRSWEDKQGQKRYTTEIVAQTVQFVGSRGERSSGQDYQQQDQSFSHNSYQDNGYQQNQNSYNNSNDNNFGNNNVGGTSSLDDIPF